MADIRFRVRFDEVAFGEDLEHASRAGRKVGQQARERLERDGIEPEALRRCEAEGADGTLLGGCVKTYLPPPDGRWGMVMSADRDENGLVLVCQAFGVRHPERAWQPSVYQVAHRRLNPRWR